MRKKEKNFLSKEMIFGLSICIIFSLLSLVTKTKFGLYPFAVLVFLSISGFLLAITPFVSKKGVFNKLEKVSIFELLFIGILLIASLVIDFVGFYTTACIALLAVSELSAKEHSVISILKRLAYSVCICIVTYFIFSFLLKINAPSGVFI